VRFWPFAKELRKAVLAIVYARYDASLNAKWKVSLACAKVLVSSEKCVTINLNYKVIWSASVLVHVRWNPTCLCLNF
jgi:hypothetical protein